MKQEIPAEILARASRGDHSAFEEIYRFSSGFVFSTAWRVTGNRESAEDVTQEVFLKVYRSLGGFKGKSAFKTWVYRITINTALEACRKASKKKHQNVSDEILEGAAAVAPEAEQALRRQDAEAMVLRMLAILTPEQRACIILREIEGLKYEEIAGVLNTNINTIRTRLKRAREALTQHAKRETMKHEL